MKSNNQIIKVNKTRTKEEPTIYIHDIRGTFKSSMPISKYATVSSRTVANVLKIATSFKGYGFDKNYDKGVFISIKQIDRLLTSTEVMKMFDKWVKDNLKQNIVKLKNMYKKNYDEEYLSQSLLYIAEQIMTERSVNDFEQALVFKYKTSYLNHKTYEDMKKKNGFSNDFHIKSDDGKELSYINDFAKDGQSLFNTKPNYDCIEDYNSIKQFDVIGYILKETVSLAKADIFVDCLQSNHDFTNFNNMPNFQYSTLVRKHKESINLIKEKGNKISNTEYLKTIIEECWNLMITKLDRIKEESKRHTFVNIEDYTLKELIQ